MPQSPARRTRAHLPSLAGAIALLASCVVLLSAAASAVAVDAYPRVLRTDTSRAPRLLVDVVVPPMLTGQVLPVSAFSVTENGQPRAVASATRLSPASLRVMLVIDTATPSVTLVAEQGAARDFLLSLPPQAEVGVVSGDADPDVVSRLGTDRQKTVRALVDLEAGPARPAQDVPGALALALTEMRPAGILDAVIVVDSHPSTQAISESASQAATAAYTAVYPILLGMSPLDYLGGISAASGGRVQELSNTEELLSAYDVVRNELLGRYRIAYTTTGQGSRTAKLTVRSGPVLASTGFVVEPGLASRQPEQATKHKEAGSVQQEAGTASRLLLGLLGAALVARLGWWWARRRYL